MAEWAPPDSLLRVATASKKQIDGWKEGVHLQTSTGHAIDDLRGRATKDRIEFALLCRRRARRLMGLAPPMYRDAISRHYYCLYHGFRAVVYYVSGGDDADDHTELPKAIPDDFPNVDVWRNDLKTARLIRNNADYSAYPKADSAWRADCETVSQLADALVAEARNYLRSKGCPSL